MSANQTKTEPIPASATESEAETPGTRPAGAGAGTTSAGGDVGDTASVPAGADEASPGTSEQAAPVQGVHQPAVEEPDTRS
jgi:hypothetical protein